MDNTTGGVLLPFQKRQRDLGNTADFVTHGEVVESIADGLVKVIINDPLLGFEVEVTARRSEVRKLVAGALGIEA